MRMRVTRFGSCSARWAMSQRRSFDSRPATPTEGDVPAGTTAMGRGRSTRADATRRRFGATPPPRQPGRSDSCAPAGASPHSLIHSLSALSGAYTVRSRTPSRSSSGSHRRRCATAVPVLGLDTDIAGVMSTSYRVNATADDGSWRDASPRRAASRAPSRADAPRVLLPANDIAARRDGRELVRAATRRARLGVARAARPTEELSPRNSRSRTGRARKRATARRTRDKRSTTRRPLGRRRHFEGRVRGTSRATKRRHG